jgi:hypothetical protein
MNKKTGLLLIAVLSLPSSTAAGKPIEFQIVIPVPFVSDQLFDSTISKSEGINDPESNLLVEEINQAARRKHHLDHPTWEEFWD